MKWLNLVLVSTVVGSAVASHPTRPTFTFPTPPLAFATSKTTTKPVIKSTATVVVQPAAKEAATVAPNAAKQCAAAKSCLRGDVAGNLCVISDGNCPPCLVPHTTSGSFGCYEYKPNELKCPFGIDCKDTFASASNTTDTYVAATVAPSTTTASAPEVVSKSNADDDNQSASTSLAKKDEKSGPSFVVIAGGVAAVLVVAVIFAVLVQRSRARDDDDDELDTPAPIKSVPRTTSNGAQYAPYPNVTSAKTNVEVAQYYEPQVQVQAPMPMQTIPTAKVVRAPMPRTSSNPPAPTSTNPVFFPAMGAAQQEANFTSNTYGEMRESKRESFEF